MNLAERIRVGLKCTLVAEMQRVDRELRAKAPIPDSTAPPLEELQRILADLQKRQPRRHPHLRTPQ